MKHIVTLCISFINNRAINLTLQSRYNTVTVLGERFSLILTCPPDLKCKDITPLAEKIIVSCVSRMTQKEGLTPTGVLTPTRVLRLEHF